MKVLSILLCVSLCMVLMCSVCSAEAVGYSYWKGDRLYGEKNYVEALKYFNKSLVHNSDKPEVWVGKGNAFRMMKLYNESLESYEEAIKVGPGYIPAWIAMSEVYVEIKDDENASLCFSEAARLDPKDKQSLYKSGYYLQKLGRFSESLSYFDRAISIDPKYAAALCSKGISLQALGNTSGALELYGNVTSSSPKYAQAYIYRGMTLESEDNYAEALGDYDEALNLSAQNWQARCGRMHCLMALGNCSEAMGIFVKL